MPMSVHLPSLGLGVGITALIIVILFFGTNYFIQPSDIHNGEIIQAENGVEVYLMQNEKKRHFLTLSVFEELGYSTDTIRYVPDWIMDRIPTGMPIKSISDL